MKKWELSLQRAVSGTVSQTYAVTAETEEDAIKMFEEAFTEGKEGSLRAGDQEITINSFGPIGKGKIKDTETEVEIEF